MLTPNGTIYTSAPQHRWVPIKGATHYQLQLYQGSKLLGYLTVSSNGCGDSYCQVIIRNDLAPGKYFWRVRAYIGDWRVRAYIGAWKEYSSYMYFTVADSPGLVSPGGTIATRNPVYQWRPVYSTTNYQIQLYQGNKLVGYPTVTSSVCANNFCSITLPYTLANGSYIWRVKSYYDGKWGEFGPE